MPLPQREYSWRDQLRNDRTQRSSSQKRALNSSQDSISLLAIPLNVSSVGTSDIHDRLYKENEFLRQKRESIYDPHRKEREFEQSLSFSPKRLRESDSQQLRSVAQFVEDQEKLREKQLEKLEMQRQKEAQPYKIAQAKQIDREQAEQTKLKIKQKFEEKKKKLILESQALFKPSISKTSIQLVKDRPNQIYSPLKRSLLEQTKDAVAPRSNTKSEEIVYQRFEREFKKAVEMVGEGEHLSKSQGFQVLKVLGFVDENTNKTINQTQLADRLLERVFEQNQKVNCDVLLYILCEIQQFNPPNEYNKKITSAQFTTFYPLVLYRKNFLRNQKIQKDTQEYRQKLQETITLSPKTNKDRNKEILSKACQSEHKFRLSENKKLKIEMLAQPVNKQDQEYMKVKLEELEMLDCTFKPKICETSRILSQPRVYEDQRKREEKTINELEYEAQAKECTFKPKINHRKQQNLYIPSAKGDVVLPSHPKMKQPSQVKQKIDQEKLEQPQEKTVQLNVRISDTESRLLIVKDAQTFIQTVRSFCEAGKLDQEQEQTLLSVISQNTGWPIKTQKDLYV